MSTLREPGVATSANTASPTSPARWWEPALLPGRWTPVLLGVVVALVSAHLLVNAVGQSSVAFNGLGFLSRWLDVDREMGLPAWFSSVLLFLCAQALWLLADRSRQGDRHRWAPRERLLSVVFVYLSIDELTSVHEQTIDPLREALDLGGVLTFAWVLLALPLVAALGLYFVPYLVALPSPVRNLMALSGLLYVGGAAGVEMVGAQIWSEGGAETMLFSTVVALEEGLEMLGAVLFLAVVTWLRTAGSRPAGPRPAPGAGSPG